MARLDNTLRERFALAVSSGMPASRAYAAAGYKARGNSAQVNASRLLRCAQVRARVDELLVETAQEFSINKAHLTWMLLEDRRVAHEKGQAAAAGAITELIGKLYGFAFDPTKQGEQRTAPSSMSRAEAIDFKAVNDRFRSLGQSNDG